MTDRPHRRAIDYEELGRYLRALAVPTRVQLLHKLQVPHAPAEIELKPFRKDREAREDRTISRQAVEKHLKALEEVGLVRSRASTREGQPVREYVVDQPRLFVVVDEMRRLGLLRATSGVETVATGAGGTVGAPAVRAGGAMPHRAALVLVSGPFEGRAFEVRGAGPWTIGRSRECDIALDYDPFVSARNSEVRREAGRYLLRSLSSSRNGTSVDWRLLARGEEVALAPGQTVGVGRSLLVFSDRA